MIIDTANRERETVCPLGFIHQDLTDYKNNFPQPGRTAGLRMTEPGMADIL
jgi:hypothetical protein